MLWIVICAAASFLIPWYVAGIGLIIENNRMIDRGMNVAMIAIMGWLGIALVGAVFYAARGGSF